MIELIIVIVLMGSIATLVTSIFAKPFLQYETLSRRATLVSLGNAAIARIEYDLKNAVPNSVRVSADNKLIEFMEIADGGRYRYVDDVSDSKANALAPGFDDSSFHVLGNLSKVGTGALNNMRLVVNPFNTEALYTAAADGGIGIITPTTTSITRTAGGTSGVPADEDLITLSNAFKFDLIGNGSPRKRFYLTDAQVSYLCVIADNEIKRYSGYAVMNSIDPSMLTGTSGALLTNQVSECTFQYETGIAQRLGIVTVTLVLEDTFNNDKISFVKQIRVSNVP